jgi:hypothetical protein
VIDAWAITVSRWLEQTGDPALADGILELFGPQGSPY